MTDNHFFQQGCRGCLTSLIITLLAICGMIISINRQYHAHPSCGGMLGAGFPALFICDDRGGGSPSSSWGKITFIDVPNGAEIDAHNPDVAGSIHSFTQPHV